LSSNPTISVVIVTRNRRAELFDSLQRLAPQSEPFELVVVDNGSDDDSAEAVRRHWSDAVVVALPENSGAAAGRNRGIEAASGEILVFLDDDASFESPDALSRIRARFAADPRLGVIAAHARLEPSRQSERAAIPRRLKSVPTADCSVSYFCAVGFAARRDALRQAGGFAEDFLYYCEELDLAWRVMEAGYGIVWIVDLVVLHRKSPLERWPGRWVYSNMRNRVRLPLKHLPWRYVATYALLWWPWLFAHAVRKRLLGDFVRGLRDFAGLLPATLAARRPLAASTRRRIRALDGRLLY